MKKVANILAAGLIVSVLNQPLLAQQPAPQAPAAALETHKPKLADIMLMLQVRHAKLSLAGEAQNWPLAEFQLEELKEAFEDAEKYYPTFKEVPVKAMIHNIAMPAVAGVEKAITAKSRGDFVRAFQNLTAACDTRHHGANRGHFVIQRPSVSSYPNQSFVPSRN